MVGCSVPPSFRRFLQSFAAESIKVIKITSQEELLNIFISLFSVCLVPATARRGMASACQTVRQYNSVFPKFILVKLVNFLSLTMKNRGLYATYSTTGSGASTFNALMYKIKSDAVYVFI